MRSRTLLLPRLLVLLMIRFYRLRCSRPFPLLSRFVLPFVPLPYSPIVVYDTPVPRWSACLRYDGYVICCHLPHGTIVRCRYVTTILRVVRAYCDSPLHCDLNLFLIQIWVDYHLRFLLLWWLRLIVWIVWIPLRTVVFSIYYSGITWLFFVVVVELHSWSLRTMRCRSVTLRRHSRCIYDCWFFVIVTLLFLIVVVDSCIRCCSGPDSDCRSMRLPFVDDWNCGRYVAGHLMQILPFGTTVDRYSLTGGRFCCCSVIITDCSADCYYWWCYRYCPVQLRRSLIHCDLPSWNAVPRFTVLFLSLFVIHSICWWLSCGNSFAVDCVTVVGLRCPLPLPLPVVDCHRYWSLPAFAVLRSATVDSRWLVVVLAFDPPHFRYCCRIFLLIVVIPVLTGCLLFLYWLFVATAVLYGLRYLPLPWVISFPIHVTCWLPILPRIDCCYRDWAYRFLVLPHADLTLITNLLRCWFVCCSGRYNYRCVDYALRMELWWLLRLFIRCGAIVPGGGWTRFWLLLFMDECGGGGIPLYLWAIYITPYHILRSFVPHTSAGYLMMLLPSPDSPYAWYHALYLRLWPMWLPLRYVDSILVVPLILFIIFVQDLDIQVFFNSHMLPHFPTTAAVWVCVRSPALHYVYRSTCLLLRLPAFITILPAVHLPLLHSISLRIRVYGFRSRFCCTVILQTYRSACRSSPDSGICILHFVDCVLPVGLLVFLYSSSYGIIPRSLPGMCCWWLRTIFCLMFGFDCYVLFPLYIYPSYWWYSTVLQLILMIPCWCIRSFLWWFLLLNTMEDTILFILACYSRWCDTLLEIHLLFDCLLMWWPGWLLLYYWWLHTTVLRWFDALRSIRIRYWMMITVGIHCWCLHWYIRCSSVERVIPSVC